MSQCVKLAHTLIKQVMVDEAVCLPSDNCRSMFSTSDESTNRSDIYHRKAALLWRLVIPVPYINSWLTYLLRKVTAGLAESNGSLPPGLWYACVSLWAWWEVVAAYHRVHDYACCHLQADCLESGISSGPYARLRVWETFTFTFYLLTQQHEPFVLGPS